MLVQGQCGVFGFAFGTHFLQACGLEAVGHCWGLPGEALFAAGLNCIFQDINSEVFQVCVFPCSPQLK